MVSEHLEAVYLLVLVIITATITILILDLTTIGTIDGVTTPFILHTLSPLTIGTTTHTSTDMVTDTIDVTTTRTATTVVTMTTIHTTDDLEDPIAEAETPLHPNDLTALVLEDQPTDAAIRMEETLTDTADLILAEEPEHRLDQEGILLRPIREQEVLEPAHRQRVDQNLQVELTIKA